jgi:hypothetical protein
MLGWKFLVVIALTLSFALNSGCSKNNTYIKSPSDQFGGGNAEPIPTAVEPLPTATPTITPVPTITPLPTLTPTGTPTPTPTTTAGPLDCHFDNYLEHVPAGCVGTQMTVGGIIVADTEVFADRILFKATKKNGGAGGSRWYDAKVILPVFRDVLLPAEINILPGGNAGNGQKLYFIFDNLVICSYRSNANIKYVNPICKVGGVIDPSKSDGFAVGVGTYKPDNTSVNHFKTLQVSVNGASGGGIVTSVVFDLFFY